LQPVVRPQRVHRAAQPLNASCGVAGAVAPGRRFDRWERERRRRSRARGGLVNDGGNWYRVLGVFAVEFFGIGVGVGW
jgi:hypothetical protein